MSATPPDVKKRCKEAVVETYHYGTLFLETRMRRGSSHKVASMSKKLLAFFRGMGSVLSVAPPRRKLSVRLEQRTMQEVLERDWKNVATDFTRALESVKTSSKSREKVDA